MTAELGTMAIRKTARVRLGVERAFELFTARMGDWWPTASHSLHGERVAEVVVEPRQGGRVFERTEDGEEADWGGILAWEPPRRLVLEWRVNPAVAATEVEVRFAAEGDGTRVELVHRGWERLGAAADEGRGSYEEGWTTVLARYEDAAARR
jgi:uncharacterized protein YndB with AHSA1/START domain